MKRRFVYLWIGIGALLLFAFLYLPGLSRYQELRSEEERISRELADLQRQIKSLQEEKSLLEKDQAYLEKVIREELGLVRPGEMVYKLVPEKKSQSGVSPSPKSNSPQAD